MSQDIIWKGLHWERRGDKVAKYRITEVRRGTALVVDCPDWIADQIQMIFGSSCESRPLAEHVADDYTHGFLFRDGAPNNLETTMQNLASVLSIPAPDYVDVAITLDMYNRPNDQDELERTPAGYWIWTTKHASEPTWSNSRNSRRLMIDALVNVIQHHPLYANATAIVTAPGHKADGQSFGEILAREVATKVGIPFVETSSPGPRPQQKETPQDLTDVFTVQEQLTGDVIVLDDVYHTGGSASGAAAAAKRAGADRALSLTVARTIRW